MKRLIMLAVSLVFCKSTLDAQQELINRQYRELKELRIELTKHYIKHINIDAPSMERKPSVARTK